MKKEYLVFDNDSQFNIVMAKDPQEAEQINSQESICLGLTVDHDKILILRIRQLIKDE